jgi:hypothetical protein
MGGMIDSPRSPQPRGYETPYRVVVRARTSSGSKKGYIWEIVREDEERRVVHASSISYKSMEEAHTDGVMALKELRAGL